MTARGSELTVVMYHYVRDLARSRFPAIKGLDLERFRGQLAYLRRHHRFVRVEEVLAAVRAEAPLPERAVLLTFDDGYSDHFRYVFPILDDLGLQGCFFPPVRPLRERVVLDVNKIHFTLAAAPDVGEVAAFCLARVDELRDEFGLRPAADYERELAVPSRLDDARTMLVKRLLQRGLPEAARARIAAEVFQRFVTADEAAFAEELYLTWDQVRTMRRAGMWFGSHGVTHRWLDSLEAPEQRWELAGAVALLDELGYEARQRVVAYPYGGFNETTLSVAGELAHGLGFTVEPRVAVLGRDDPLRLPRLDTVDLPCDPDAPPPSLRPGAAGADDPGNDPERPA
jgi:peptidoglycan/xylan/chitin deacetylase (PgdA/CDA1 family)